MVRDGRSRPRRRGLALTVGIVTLFSVTAACGDDTSGSEESAGGDVIAGAVEFQATSQFLDKASERSLNEPYRIDVSMSMDIAGGGDELSAEAPIMTGEQAGTSYEMTMDMGEWLDEMPGGAASTGVDDWTVEMAGDPSTMYIRAPVYAALAEQPGVGDLGPVGELAVLGDSWGRVDLQALGDLSLTDVQSTVGSPNGADPRAILDLVANADDVEELGTDEVDGVGVNGLGASVSLGDMLEAQGTDVEKFVQQMSANMAGLGEVDSTALADVMQTIADALVPFEVWVDGDGYVRRVSYEMDTLDIFDGTSIGDTLEDEGLEAFSVGTTTDYSDYGDDSIAIELPPPGAENAVDVTDAYREMLEAGQSGG
jgi:hypothetical protein